MKRELWESDYTDLTSLVLIEDDQVVAIYYCDDDYEKEVEDRLGELEADPMAYLGWKSGYNKYTVWRASEEDRIDKYDEDGNEVDLKEHPWTLQELYDDIIENSVLLRPFYVCNITDDGVKNVRGFYNLDKAKNLAREMSQRANGIVEVRQYEDSLDDDKWDGFTDYATFDWKEPVHLDGRKVKIIFVEDGEIAEIDGVIVLAEEDRIHIVRN